MGAGCGGRGVGLNSGGDTGLTMWLASQVDGGKHTMFGMLSIIPALVL
jgi:hypothetical protein